MNNRRLQQAIDHSLIFIDTGADTLYPIESSEEGLWDQGNIQLAIPVTSSCCTAMVIEHKDRLYCIACGGDLESHEMTAEVNNLITH